MAEKLSANNRVIPMKDIIAAGLEELLGDLGKDRVMVEAEGHGNLSDSKYYLLDIFHSLEDEFGVQGGRGVAYQMGRTSFLTILQKEGQLIGILDRECRFLPSKRRIETSFRLLAQAFSDLWGLPTEFETSDAFWEWHTMKGCSYFFMGLLQECLAWICGDKIFQLEEADFSKQDGRYSVIHIQKVPLNL